MTNQELTEQVIPGLEALNEMVIPVEVALQIRTILRSLRHLRDDFQEERKRLIERYSLKTEKGEPKLIVTDPTTGAGFYDFGENAAAFKEQFDELFLEVEVAGKPAPIKASRLAGMSIKGKILDMIGEMLIDDTEQ